MSAKCMIKALSPAHLEGITSSERERERELQRGRRSAGRGKTRFMASFGAHFPLHWTPSGAVSRRRRRFPRFVFVKAFPNTLARSVWASASQSGDGDDGVKRFGKHTMLRSQLLPPTQFPLLPLLWLLLCRWWASQRGRAHMTAYDLQCFVLFAISSRSDSPRLALPRFVLAYKTN